MLKRIAFALSLVLIAAALLFLTAGAGFVASWRTQTMLADLGFEKTVRGAAAFDSRGVTVTGMKLDPNGFSTLDMIRIGGTSRANFVAGGKFADIVIEDATLTAALSADGKIDITGLTPVAITALPAMFRKNNIRTMAFNKAVADIDTPFGAIRMQVKGQITALPDGGLRVQGALWGVQHQLSTTLAVQGEIGTDGTYSLDIEVQEGKINTAALSASRIGGWIIINNADNGGWRIGAQLAAGQMMWRGLAMNNITATLNGTAAALTGTAQATPAGTTKTRISADWAGTPKKTNGATITIDSDDAGDFLYGFLPALTGVAQTEKKGKAASRPGLKITATRANDASGYAITAAGLDEKIWMTATWRKAAEGPGTQIDLQSLNMKQAASAAGWKNLRIGGDLSGLIELAPAADDAARWAAGWVVTQALLKTAETGNLTYTAETFPNHMTVEDAGEKDTIALLGDFEFGLIEIYTEGPVAGPMETDISIAGKTAGKKGTKPDIINLTTSAGLTALTD